MVTDKIVIKNLSVTGIIGVNAAERLNKQKIVLNLTLFVPVFATAETENLDNMVDYEEVVNAVRSTVGNATDYLVERLAARIIDRIFGQFVIIDRIILRVEKPDAIPDTESVGVEIDRVRSDWLAMKGPVPERGQQVKSTSRGRRR